MNNLKKNSEEEIKNHIIGFLENTRVLTLATSANAIPWAATLAFAYEQNFNLYCITNGQSRHVQEIRQNSSVSVAMYETQMPAYNPLTVKGLQLEGRAEVLAGSDVLYALKVFVGRFPKAEAMSVERLFQLKTARIIRIKPTKLYYLDRGHIGERVEILLH